jgi:YD repeat-containing protein
LTLVVTLALLATAVVAGVPAASAAVKAGGHPAARAAARPDNTVKVPGAMADLAAAKRDHRKVEVAAARTAFSQTFANPDGSLTTSVSQQPRWVKRGSGWVTASADLVRTVGGTLSPQAAETGLQLSGGGTKVLARLGSGARSMSLSWPSVLPAPQVRGPRATYASVFPGVDLVVAAQVSGGFDETLVIHGAAAARDPQLRNLTLGVWVSKGLAQRAGKDGAVSVQTTAGKAVFSSPAPVAWDSARPAGSGAVSTVAGPARGAHVAMVPARYGAGSVITNIPSSLTGASAVYPVYVDPAYSQTQAWEGYGEIQSAFPNNNELNNTYDGKVSVGNDGSGVDRGNYVLGLPPLPTGLAATVTSATFTGEVVTTDTSASESHTVNLYDTAQYTSSSTWNSPPAQTAGPVAATFSTASTTPNQNVPWNVTSWMQTALNSGAFQLSVELVNSDETDVVSQFLEFSANPTLTYTYTQPAPSIPLGSGPVMNATQLKFPISDKAALKVNVGSGDALFTTSDIALPEQGSSLTLGVAYNSLLAGSQVSVGSDGVGWRQREGVDERLYLGADGSLTYLGEDGNAGKFTAGSGSSFVSPPQFHVTLAKSTTACGGTGYTMTWHSPGDVECYNANGLLTSEADRNGNTTAYSYNSSNQETQITYTPKGASSPNETVTATYSGSYLNTLSESGGSLGTRTVTYTVNGNGDLQKVQQADGTLLQFGYDSSHNLTSIENGASITTHLYYDASHRVTSVGQTYGSCGCTATTRLSYVSATETQVADPNTNQSLAVSAVPNTTYTINSQDLVTTTVDQQGHTFTATYNGQDDQTGTSNADGGSTINTWAPGADGVDENLTQNQSAMGATTKAQYTNTRTAPTPPAISTTPCTS